MLNSLSKAEPSFNDHAIALPIDRHKSSKTPLSVDVIYRQNDYLNSYHKTRGVWISQEQICFRLISAEQLIVNQILFLSFVTPEKNIKIFMKVTIVQIENDQAIANHDSAHQHYLYKFSQ